MITLINNRLEEAFRNERAPKHIFLEFDDYVFTDGDISVQEGVKLQDTFCPDEDLSYGNPSAVECSVTLFNDDGVLNDFKFGHFKLFFGAAIDQGEFTSDANVMLMFSGVKYEGFSQKPYLRLNGASASVQPNFPVYSIVIRDSKVVCYGLAGEVFIYNGLDCKTASTSVNSETWNQQKSKTWNTEKARTWGDLNDVTLLDGFQKVQAMRFARKGLGIGYDRNNEIAYVYYGTTKMYETCAFMQRGEFWAERPIKVKTSRISIIGYDGMVHYMENPSDSITWTDSISPKETVDKIVAANGLTATNFSDPNQSLNSVGLGTTFVTDRTYREVLADASEAALLNPYFNNKGQLSFRRMKDTSNIRLTPKDYSDFAPYSYDARGIEGVYLKQSDNDVGAIVNDGTNVFVLSENPFLTFGTAALGNTLATNLYRVMKGHTYTPGSVRWFGSPVMEAGDLLQVLDEKNVPYLLPIFNLTITYNGMFVLEADATGREQREQTDFKHREEYKLNKKIFELEKDADGLRMLWRDYQDQIDGQLSDYEATFTATAQGMEANFTAYKEEINSGYADQFNLITAGRNYLLGTQTEWVLDSDTSKAWPYRNRKTYKVSPVFSKAFQRSEKTIWISGEYEFKNFTHKGSIHCVYLELNYTRTDTSGANQEIGWQSGPNEFNVPITNLTKTGKFKKQFSGFIGTDHEFLSLGVNSMDEELVSQGSLTIRNLRLGFEEDADYTVAPEDLEEVSKTAYTARYYATAEGFGALLTANQSFKDTQGNASSAKQTAEYVASATGFSALLNADSSFTTVKAQAGQIEAKVDKNGVIAAIAGDTSSAKISGSKIDLSSAEISLTGRTSLNNKVVIGTDGKLTAEDGTFTNAAVTGSLTAGKWKFDSSGGNYVDGSTSLEMFAGNGTAFFYSRGLDTYLGADLSHDVEISGRTIKFQATNQGQFVGLGGGYADNGYDTSFVNLSASSSYPAGNIGTFAYPWDVSVVKSRKTPSSRKIKDNIEAMPNMESILRALEPVTFTYIGRPEEKCYGLILEDTAEVFPDICRMPKNENEVGAISYDNLISVLVKAVQELYERMEQYDHKGSA